MCSYINMISIFDRVALSSCFYLVLLGWSGKADSMQSGGINTFVPRFSHAGTAGTPHQLQSVVSIVGRTCADVRPDASVRVASLAGPFELQGVIAPQPLAPLWRWLLRLDLDPTSLPPLSLIVQHTSHTLLAWNIAACISCFFYLYSSRRQGNTLPLTLHIVATGATDRSDGHTRHLAEDLLVEVCLSSLSVMTLTRRIFAYRHLSVHDQDAS